MTGRDAIAQFFSKVVTSTKMGKQQEEIFLLLSAVAESADKLPVVGFVPPWVKEVLFKMHFDWRL